MNKRRAAESWKEKNRVIKRGEMDVLGFSVFSGTFPTCLKTSQLNENTNLCPGWRRGDPFVADPVIMFSVLLIQSVFQNKKNVQHAQYTLLCGVYKCLIPQC